MTSNEQTNPPAEPGTDGDVIPPASKVRLPDSVTPLRKTWPVDRREDAS